MNKLLNRLIWLFIAAPDIYLAIAWAKLPAIVPVHFNLKGIPDRYGSKNELLIVLIVLSAVSLGVYFLLQNIHRIDPRRHAEENKGRLQRIGFALVVFISALSCLIIYSSSTSTAGFDSGLILGATGLLFAIIGNYMPNLKQNYFAGIRVPWTLDNADNWKKTHALAGKIWFAGGLFIAVACLLTSAKIAFVIFITAMVILVVVPCVFSYNLYKRQKAAQQLN